MKLTKEQIKRFFDTLISIIEDRENVKITYKLIEKNPDNESSQHSKSPHRLSLS